MHSVLYGVSPTDPFTSLSVAVALFGAALLACYIPARSAVGIEPIIALRHE
jgi:putative ABC transport system permease protein